MAAGRIREAINGPGLPYVFVGLVVGIGTSWIVMASKLSEKLVGWQKVCYGAPYVQMTPAILQGLSEAGLHVGLRGWQPTVEWVNEQCTVMKSTRETE